MKKSRSEKKKRKKKHGSYHPDSQGKRGMGKGKHHQEKNITRRRRGKRKGNEVKGILFGWGRRKEKKKTVLFQFGAKGKRKLLTRKRERKKRD